MRSGSIRSCRCMDHIGERWRRAMRVCLLLAGAVHRLWTKNLRTQGWPPTRPRCREPFRGSWKARGGRIEDRLPPRNARGEEPPPTIERDEDAGQLGRQQRPHRGVCSWCHRGKPLKCKTRFGFVLRTEPESMVAIVLQPIVVHLVIISYGEQGSLQRRLTKRH